MLKRYRANFRYYIREKSSLKVRYEIATAPSWTKNENEPKV